MYCVETINLTHQFSGTENVLNKVDLRVSEGTIYGFLGPNGAGKTTTLKLILGLLKKQSGEIFLFGRSFPQNRVEALKNIGAMIESPSIYGHLTAAENLRILQKVYRCPLNRIEKVLELVDLARAGNKKAGRFSLGMKQRLGIAAALLHSPKLLILDEPTNGLDPNGMLEIRQLLKDLARLEGVTILLSSHLLSEIEKLVTHVGIIDSGKLLFQGTLAALLEKQKQSAYITFRTGNNRKAQSIFAERKLSSRIEAEKIVIPIIEEKEIALINRQLVSRGIDIYEISVVKNDLEKIFFEVIKS